MVKGLKWVAGLAGGVFVVSLAVAFILVIKGTNSGDFWTAVEDLGERASGPMETGEEFVSADGITRLELDVDEAEVTFVREVREDIGVHYEVSRQDWLEGAVSIERDEDSVYITCSETDDWHIVKWGELSRRCVIRVALPMNFAGDLTLDGDASNIHLEGAQTFDHVEAWADASTLHLGELTANEVAIHAAAGALRAGKLDAPTVSLEIDAASAHLEGLTGSVNLCLSTGEAELSFQRLGGPLDAEVDMGSAVIQLPRETQATLSLEADMGSVSQSCKGFSGQENPRRVEGSLNGGGISIEGTVSMGALKITDGESAPTSASIS